MVVVRRSSPPRARDCISPDGSIVEVEEAIQLKTPGLVSPARRRADQLSFCAAVAYAAHPLLGHGALFFPVVAKGGVERYGGVANSLSGPPSPGQLALPAALGTRWSPCRRPSRDAQTEDLRSPTSTGLGRGVAAPFARRRPNRGCALAVVGARAGQAGSIRKRFDGLKHIASLRRPNPTATPDSDTRRSAVPAQIHSIATRRIDQLPIHTHARGRRQYGSSKDDIGREGSSSEGGGSEGGGAAMGCECTQPRTRLP